MAAAGAKAEIQKKRQKCGMENYGIVVWCHISIRISMESSRLKSIGFAFFWQKKYNSTSATSHRMQDVVQPLTQQVYDAKNVWSLARDIGLEERLARCKDAGRSEHT